MLFGQGAIKLSQQSSFIALSYNDGIFAQNEDFLIDFWFYKDQNVAGKHEAVIANDYASRNSGNFTSNWRLLYNHISGEGFKFIHNQSSQVLNSGPIVLGQWNYLAIERYNGNLYMYLNGALVSSPSNITKAMNPFGLLGSEAQTALGYATIEEFNQNFPNSCFEIGAVPTLGGTYVGFDGQIQDFRIVQGESGYNGSSFSLESNQSQSSFLHVKSTGIARSVSDSCTPIDSGQSAVFNGSTSNLKLNVKPSANSFTASMWVKFNNILGYSDVLGTINPSFYSTGFSFGLENGKFKIVTDNDSAAHWMMIKSFDQNIYANKWYHICLVSDGNNNTLYIDGVESTATLGQSGTGTTQSQLYDNNNDFEISFTNSLNGFVDQVRDILFTFVTIRCNSAI